MADAPARLEDLCLDSHDHQATADRWCAALGYVRRAAARPRTDPVAIEHPRGCFAPG